MIMRLLGCTCTSSVDISPSVTPSCRIEVSTFSGAASTLRDERSLAGAGSFFRRSKKWFTALTPAIVSRSSSTYATEVFGAIDSGIWGTAERGKTVLEAFERRCFIAAGLLDRYLSLSVTCIHLGDCRPVQLATR